MAALKVFLDSNILFSAALGGEMFELLWELAESGKVRLFTSCYCHTEAIENLKRKHPRAVRRYVKLMGTVLEVEDDSKFLDWANTLLPEKDAPVLAAAVGAKVDVLLTGDIRHFGALMKMGALMKSVDLPCRVTTIRTFLLEGANPSRAK